MLRNKTTYFLFTLCMLSLLIAWPQTGYADELEDLQNKAQAAQEQLDSLGNQVMVAGEKINDIEYQISTTKDKIKTCEGQISDLEAQVGKDRQDMCEVINASYKRGPLSFVRIIFNSDSLESLINNTYYVLRINRQQQAGIDAINEKMGEVASNKAELVALQNEQEGLLSAQNEELETLKKAQSEKSQYLDSLDSQIKEEVKRQEEERKRKEEEERKRQEELAEKREQERLEAEKKAEEQRKREEEANSKPQDNQTDSSDTSDTSSVAGARKIIVDTALSKQGCPYVWAEAGPNVFDCSGFTKYCYGQAGIYLPHSAMGQASAGRRVSESQAQPGDLVTWILCDNYYGSQTGPGNHVAIYLGNNKIIHCHVNRVFVTDMYNRQWANFRSIV